jgi:hypothetical protein
MWKRFRSWPYARPLAILVSVSAGLIVGNLIREGSVSYGQSLGLIVITAVLVGAFWLGEQLLRRERGSSGR